MTCDSFSFILGATAVSVTVEFIQALGKEKGEGEKTVSEDARNERRRRRWREVKEEKEEEEEGKKCT